MAFNLVERRRVTRWGELGLLDDKVGISYVRGGGTARRSVSVVLGIEVVRELRWVIGDRIQVLIGDGDDQGTVLLARVQPEVRNSYALSANGKKASKVKGKVCKGEVRWSGDDKFVAGAFSKGNYSRQVVEHEITEAGLLLLVYN